MTSIVIFQSEREAVVAMDTLAIDMDHNPARYTTKAHYLPHLRTIIAGTGCGGFADDWYAEANKRMVVRNVETLNRLAPAMLRELWAKFREDYTVPEDMTTTVFHVGLSEDTGIVVAAQFHSAHDFEPEPVDGPLSFKPVCPEPAELAQEGLDAFDLIHPIMEAQRAHEAGKHAAERVYIGGEVHVLHLTEAGCAQFKVFEFPEYQQEREGIYRRVEAGQAQASRAGANRMAQEHPPIAPCRWRG